MRLSVTAFGSIRLGRFRNEQARPLGVLTTSGYLAYHVKSEGILGIVKSQPTENFAEIYLEPNTTVGFWSAKGENDPTPDGDILSLRCSLMGAEELEVGNLRKMTELHAYGNDLLKVNLSTCFCLRTAYLGKNLLGVITLPKVSSLACHLDEQKVKGYPLVVKVEERPLWAIMPMEVDYETVFTQAPKLD